jgi:hypothetical protein
MRDEATERQFLQSLRQIGVPIPDGDLMVGIHWDYGREGQLSTTKELKTKTISAAAG